MAYNGKMLREQLSTFWHQSLDRPYRLHVGINQNPTGLNEVVLLHGIGRSSDIWHHVAEFLASKPYHLLAFDLLGFGASSKPTWLEYSVEDHAKAVIASVLRYSRHNRPVTFVGHSMGCLIAVQVAVMRPDLVDRLILYEPPIYAGLPNKRRYNFRTDLYYRLYKYFIENPETTSSSRLRRLLVARTGIPVQPEILRPFLKSLQHTIMDQTTLQDMQKLKTPMEIIYGSRDILVIRGSAKNVFKGVVAPLQTHTIRELHVVSQKASRFIARQINLALTQAKYESD